MHELVQPFITELKTVAASALAVPSSASDGADVSSWRSGSHAKTMRAFVYLYGTAATLSAVWLWGYRHGRWHRLGQLNGGSDIPITSATQGYSEVIGFVGIFTRLAVSATGAASITQEFEPGEVVG